MADPGTAREGVFDRLQAPGAGGMVRPLPPAARFILRGRPLAIDAAAGAFGIDLPREACRAAVAGERAALWLGPDEWLLLAPEGEAAALAGALTAALAGTPHSLVEVSHRQAALEVAGPGAETLLAAGCPLDLDLGAFPVGMCTRTLLAKSGIVLWRPAADRFRLEIARSFAAYAWDFLAEAGRELLP